MNTQTVFSSEKDQEILQSKLSEGAGGVLDLPINKNVLKHSDFRLYWNVDNVRRPAPFIVNNGWLAFAETCLEVCRKTQSNGLLLHLPFSDMTQEGLPQQGPSIMRPAGWAWSNMNRDIWKRHADFGEFLEAMDLLSDNLGVLTIYEGSLRSQGYTPYENAIRIAKTYSDKVFKTDNVQIILDQGGLMDVEWVYNIHGWEWSDKNLQRNKEITDALQLLIESGVINGGELALNLGHPYIGNPKWWVYALNTVIHHNFNNWGVNPEHLPNPRVAFVKTGPEQKDHYGRTGAEAIKEIVNRGWGCAANVRDWLATEKSWHDFI